MRGQQGDVTMRFISGVFRSFMGVGLAVLLMTSWMAEAKTDDVVMVPESFSALAEKVSPAVVNVRTEKTVQGSGRGLRQFALGYRFDLQQKRGFAEDGADDNGRGNAGWRICLVACQRPKRKMECLQPCRGIARLMVGLGVFDSVWFDDRFRILCLAAAECADLAGSDVRLC